MGVVIALLVLLSAFFSATETAFSFVNKIRVQLKPRTQHERVRVHGEKEASIKARVGMPKTCPACLTEDEIDEVLEENQWWWHCRKCDNKWDPVTKK